MKLSPKQERDSRAGGSQRERERSSAGSGLVRRERFANSEQRGCVRESSAVVTEGTEGRPRASRVRPWVKVLLLALSLAILTSPASAQWQDFGFVNNGRNNGTDLMNLLQTSLAMGEALSSISATLNSMSANGFDQTSKTTLLNCETALNAIKDRIGTTLGVDVSAIKTDLATVKDKTALMEGLAQEMKLSVGDHQAVTLDGMKLAIGPTLGADVVDIKVLLAAMQGQNGNGNASILEAMLIISQAIDALTAAMTANQQNPPTTVDLTETNSKLQDIKDALTLEFETSPLSLPVVDDYTTVMDDHTKIDEVKDKVNALVTRKSAKVDAFNAKVNTMKGKLDNIATSFDGSVSYLSMGTCNLFGSPFEIRLDWSWLNPAIIIARKVILFMLKIIFVVLVVRVVKNGL